MTNAMGSLYQAKLPPINFYEAPFLLGTWREIFVGPNSIRINFSRPIRDRRLCGMAVSLLAAALPAYKASNLSPLEAMRNVRAEELEGSSRWLV